MPEGPEVKLSSDLLRPLVVGKRILNVFIGNASRYRHQPPEGFDRFAQILKDNVCFVSSVRTHGKFIYFEMSGGWFLLNTFGMSGQWSPEQGKHLCLGMYLGENKAETECTYIHFNDPRHFGTIKFTDNFRDLREKLDRLGWDPFQEAAHSMGVLLSIKKPIAEVLMDQKIFSGVGNYIRAEGLYRAKLNPFRPANSLSESEIENLCQCVHDVMQESYLHQGATIQTYKTVYGEDGKYSSKFQVYGKKKDPLGNRIVKQNLAGRTIHWCPAVQGEK